MANRDFLVKAEECLALAVRTPDRDERLRLCRLAGQWIDLAHDRRTDAA